MPKIHFAYTREGEKNYVKHKVDIFVDDEIFANYESAKKTDLSVSIYAFYEGLGITLKPVFDGVDFPDTNASMDQLRELTGKLSDFRVWKKKSS